MALLEFTNGRTTIIEIPDIYIALFLLTLTVIGTPLNSLVLLHNCRKPSSIARNLYLGLGTADLISCLLGPVYATTALLAGKAETTMNSGNENGWAAMLKRQRQPFPYEVVLGTIVWSVAFAPCILTGFLAMTRYHQIKYPFRAINYKITYALVLLGILYKPTFLCLVFSANPTDMIYIPYALNVWIKEDYDFYGSATLHSKSLFFLADALFMITQAAAVVASILTVIELGRNYLSPMSSNSRKSNLKGSIKILVANAGSVVLLVFMIFTACLINEVKLITVLVVFGYSNAIPAISSALNPLIYILLTPSARKIIIKSKKNAVNKSTRCTVVAPI